MTIGGQTLTGPRGGLPHGGQLVDRRLDAGEAAARSWISERGYGETKWGRRRW